MAKMFSGFSFGKKKSKEEPAKPSNDPLSYITQLSKQLTDDPAILNETMRELSGLFSSTPAHLHDKIDLALGTLIAQHASRLLATVWTVLLQELREIIEPKAQLRILKHFSGVSSRIAIPQRSSAFAAFSKEIMLLLGSQDVVGNRQFVPIFRDIIVSLGLHGSEHYCQSLLEKAINGVLAWKRLDARRSAASVAALMIRYTRYGETYSHFLETVKERDPFSRALLIDAALPILLEHAEILHCNPTEFKCVKEFRDYVQVWLVELLQTDDPASLETSLLSSVVRSFERLVDAMPEVMRESRETMEGLLSNILKLLNDSRLKKVLRCPLLHLFGSLKVSKCPAELVAAGDDLVRSSCLNDDPTLRAEAWGCLNVFVAGKLSINSTKSTSGTEEVSVLALLRQTIEFFKAQHEIRFQEGCNLTLKAMLSFLKDFAPLCNAHVHKDQLSFGELMEYVFRIHSDRGNKLNLTPSIQVGLLEVLQRVTTGLSNVYLLNYTLDSVLDTDVKVREKAIETLLALAAVCPIEEEELRKTQHYDVMSYLEGVECASASHKPESFSADSQDSHLGWVRKNFATLLTFTHRTIVRTGSTLEKKQLEVVKAMCSVVRAVCSAAQGQSLEALSVLCMEHVHVLVDLLSTHGTIPADLIVEILETIAVCLDAVDGDTLFGDASDGYTHKMLFHFAWGILASSASLIDPVAIPKLPPDASLYVCYFKGGIGMQQQQGARQAASSPTTPGSPGAGSPPASPLGGQGASVSDHTNRFATLEQMVHTIGQGAQTGSQEQFLEIVDAALRILSSIVLLGRNSHIFRVQMKMQSKLVLSILDITAAVRPARTIHACQHIFTALFVDERAEDSERLRYESFDQLTTFLKRTIPVINRTLLFDLSRVGVALFTFLEYVVSLDQQLSDTRLYDAMDPTKALFKRMHQIALDESYYNSVVGPVVPLSLIRVICALTNSEHKTPLYQAIESTPTELINQMIDLAAETARKYDADTFLSCHVPLATISPKAASLLNWDTALNWNPQQWAIAESSTAAFDNDSTGAGDYLLHVLYVASQLEGALADDTISPNQYHATASSILSVCSALSRHLDSTDVVFLVNENRDVIEVLNAVPLLCLCLLSEAHYVPQLLSMILRRIEDSEQDFFPPPTYALIIDILQGLGGGGSGLAAATTEIILSFGECFDIAPPRRTDQIFELLEYCFAVGGITWEGDWIHLLQTATLDSSGSLFFAILGAAVDGDSLPVDQANPLFECAVQTPAFWRQRFYPTISLSPASTKSINMVMSMDGEPQNAIPAMNTATDVVLSCSTARNAAKECYVYLGRSAALVGQLISQKRNKKKHRLQKKTTLNTKRQ